MSSTMPARPKRFLGFTIFVCIAATIIAAFMGLLAMAPYMMAHDDDRGLLRLLPVVGIGGGAVSGLLAGIIWCQVMMRPSTLEHRRSFGRLGARVGIGVGSLAAILLQAAMMIYVAAAADRWHPINLLIGLAFGIPIGAALGAICGYALRRKVDAINADTATTHTHAPPDPPDTPA